MSQITKNAITEETLRLAQTKSITRITVREITKNCDITRNTFYYYFHDVFDVLDQKLSELIDQAKEQYDGDIEKAFFMLIEKSASYKKLWTNILTSIGREKFSNYILGRMRTFLDIYFDNLDETKYLNANDRELITQFYEEAFLGIMIRWLMNSKSSNDIDDLMYNVDRIKILFKGQLTLIINNSRNNPPSQQEIA